MKSSLILLAVAIGGAIPLLLHQVILFGHFIPQTEICADYVIAASWAMAIALSIFYWPIPQSHRRALLILWTCRMGVTLLLMLIYENHYGLDAYGYYLRGIGRWDSLRAYTLGDGTHFIDYLVWFQNGLLPSSFHATKVTFAFIGMLGVYFYWLGFKLLSPSLPISFLWGLGLIPSILFWGSTLGKDAILLFSSALFFWGACRAFQKKSWDAVLPMGAGFLLTLAIRPWLGMLWLGPFVVVFCLFKMRGASRVIGAMALCGIALLSMRVLSHSFGISAIADIPQLLDSLNDQFSMGNSGQQHISLDSFDKWLRFIPFGIYSALFRPMPWELGNIAGIASGVENLILFSICLLALFRAPLKIIGNPIWIWFGLTILVWGIAYGPVSSGNLGTGVRFRLQVLPLLVFILYLSLNWRSTHAKSRLS